MSDSMCWTYHARKGLVSTHPPGTLPVHDTHMSVVSCDRPNCIRAWKGYVTRETGLTSKFYPDPQRAR